MKRNNLIVGIVFTCFGIASLLAALLTQTKLDSLLFGFAGAGIVPGLMMIGKYFYWSAPQNRETYRKKLEAEQIELHDELKEKLRDKSGRYAYILGILLTCAAMIVFTVLGRLEIVSGCRVLVLYLGAYLAIQILAGFVIFKRLLKRY